MDTPITLKTLPVPLDWHVAAADWQIGEGQALSIRAQGRTDLFIDPQGKQSVLSAPRALAALSGDFLISARISVEFAATFDAGALLLWRDETNWGKLCFEYSPQLRPMVVSVVTHGRSDDANAHLVEGSSVWLRVARIGEACAFHASDDGQTWSLIRHFALGGEGTLQFGFVAQSPTGEGCSATFDHIRYLPERLGDIRSGA